MQALEALKPFRLSMYDGIVKVLFFVKRFKFGLVEDLIFLTLFYKSCLFNVQLQCWDFTCIRFSIKH